LLCAQGLHWVLEYYYRGVASWKWYYPHHYAPMVSDMVNISEFRVSLEPGTPFLPFQQLLSVLPAASCKLLPAPYQVCKSTPVRVQGICLLLPHACPWQPHDRACTLLL
jgi:5'-3' exoribonuclease 1